MREPASSNLSNRFPETEKLVNEDASAYLTKSGSGTTTAMSLVQPERINDNVEHMLDEADAQTAVLDVRYTHEQGLSSLRRLISHDVVEAKKP